MLAILENWREEGGGAESDQCFGSGSLSEHPDTAFRQNTNPDPNPIRIQGFDDEKLKKNYS